MGAEYSGDRAGSWGSGEGVPISAPAGGYAARWGNLPRELRERPQWLLAAPDARGDLKVPTSVNAASELVRGSSTDRATWMPFETACMWAVHHRLGIGYVLSADDPYGVIDLDVKNSSNAPTTPHKWTTPETMAKLMQVYSHFCNTYTERSQSGQGVHIWCLGKIGVGRKDAGIEVYSQTRFMVCTGDMLRPLPITDYQSELTKIAAWLRPVSADMIDLIELPATRSDDQVMSDLYNNPKLGWKFRELWEGRWQALGLGDGSQSAADYDLMTMLCFNQPSNEQARRLFGRSALALTLRRKPKPHRYIDMTIAAVRQAQGAKRQALSTWLGTVDSAWAAELAARECSRQKF